MPRTLQEILDHAGELAEQFESGPELSERPVEQWHALRAAVIARGEAEVAVVAAVTDARRVGYSWADVGSLVGTAGESARQRYGVAVADRLAELHEV